MHTNGLSPKPSLIGQWLIPFFIIALLVYTWFTFFRSVQKPLWQHWIGLISFIIIIISNIIKARIGVLMTAVYLLLAIFGLVALFPALSISYLRIGALSIPLGQLIAWPFLIIHVCINFNPLADYYLDWKEPREV